MDKSDAIPVGYDSPTDLPGDGVEAEAWQEANRTWWERHPMRYDWKQNITSAEFSPQFYADIDARFFASARTFMPWKNLPFESLIPYANLGELDVLEIGVGNGTHAELLASRARSFIGIDLTDYAVRSTISRLCHAGIPNPDVRHMDAEQLDLPDNSVDLIWSWGVIHHSSNTRRVLEEMHRVLRPSGSAVTMVYHRSFWVAWIVNWLFRGVLRGDIFKTRSLHRTLQRNTDGAIARYYTRAEWRALVSPLFRVTDTRIYGNKALLVPLPAGRIKDAIVSRIPDSFARLFLTKCRMGMLLVTTLEPAVPRGAMMSST